MKGMDVIRKAVERVRTRAAEEREQFEDAVRAAALDWAANVVETALQQLEVRTVTYAEASEESGYSVSALEKMVADGRLQRVPGIAGVRFFARDLPNKPQGAEGRVGSKRSRGWSAGTAESTRPLMRVKKLK